MITPREVEGTEELIVELLDALEHLISYATSDNWKNDYVEEMDHFYHIHEKLKELGYEPTEAKT